MKAKSNVGLLHPKLENTQTSITSGDTRVAGAFSRNFVFCFFAAAPRVKLRITARGATVRRRAPLRGAGRLRDLAFEGFASCFLRQCSGEKSIFFNNATNELLFGRKHCFYDLNIKMVHFCTFIMRLLWKLGKIAAILDSRRRKKRSQF